MNGSRGESYGEGWVGGRNGYHVYMTRSNGVRMVDEGTLPSGRSIGDTVVDTQTGYQGKIIQANVYTRAAGARRSGDEDYNVQFRYDRSQRGPETTRVVAKKGQTVPKQDILKGTVVRGGWRSIDRYKDSQYTVDGYDASYQRRVQTGAVGGVRGAGLGVPTFDVVFRQPNGIEVRVPDSDIQRRVRRV